MFSLQARGGVVVSSSNTTPNSPSLPPTALWNKIRPPTGPVDVNRSRAIIQQVIQQRPTLQDPTRTLPSTSQQPTVVTTVAPPTAPIVVRPGQQQQQLPTSVQTLLLGGKTVTLARPMMTTVVGPNGMPAAPAGAGGQLRPFAPPQQLVIVSQAGQPQQSIQLLQSGGAGGHVVLASSSSHPTVTTSSGGVFRVPSTHPPTTVVVEASGIAGQPSTTKQVPQAVLVRSLS